MDTIKMKNIFTKSLSIILLGLSIITLFSCKLIFGEGEPPLSTTTYIFVDKTDKKSTKEIITEQQIDNIFDGIGWSEGGNLYNGGSLKIMEINDVSMNKAVTFELHKADESKMTSNERSIKVRKFKKEVKSSILKFVSELSFGNEQSEIYRNLCKQIQNLNNEKSDKKNIIIYSDMLENSPIFTLYGKVINTKEILSRAEKECSFPQMSEINVYIIPPVNIENKDLVSRSEKFWTELFLQKQVKKFNGFNVDLKLD